MVGHRFPLGLGCEFTSPEAECWEIGARLNADRRRRQQLTILPEAPSLPCCQAGQFPKPVVNGAQCRPDRWAGSFVARGKDGDANVRRVIVWPDHHNLLLQSQHRGDRFDQVEPRWRGPQVAIHGKDWRQCTKGRAHGALRNRPVGMVSSESRNAIDDQWPGVLDDPGDGPPSMITKIMCGHVWGPGGADPSGFRNGARATPQSGHVTSGHPLRQYAVPASDAS